MSEEPITLEFLGARVANLTDRVNGLELGMRDLSIRFGALEARFSALEARIDLQGQQISRILAIITRLAARLDPQPL